MPNEIYIIIERIEGKAPCATPYLSEESAKQHYEENVNVYTDIWKTPAHIPFLENSERTWFKCGDFECAMMKEEVYA